MNATPASALGGAQPPPAAGPAQQHGMVVGVVDGAVSVERVRPSTRGLDFLATVLLLTVAGAIVQTLRTGRIDLITWLLLPALVSAGLVGLAWRRRRPRAERSAQEETDGEPVRRFRVRSITGEVVACILRGELAGDHIRHGDVVQVAGSQRRDGAFVARYVDVLSTPVGPVISRVTGRRGLRRRALAWADRLAYALSALITLWALLTLTGVVHG